MYLWYFLFEASRNVSVKTFAHFSTPSISHFIILGWSEFKVFFFYSLHILILLTAGKTWQFSATGATIAASGTCFPVERTN